MKKMKFVTGAVLMLSTAFASLSAREEHITYDYIIVGNGTAGAVLARKLSDDKKTKVLVLESGVNVNDDPEILAATGNDLFTKLTDLTVNPKYAETYAFDVFNTPLIIGTGSEGRVWGGSSAHNYLEVVRGSPKIYDSWASISGNSMWSYNNVLPIMKAFENYTPGPVTAHTGTFDAAQRGVGGPISVSQGTDVSGQPLAAALATALNAGFIDDYNDPTALNTNGITSIGVCAYQGFATSVSPGVFGYRSFSANSFLPASIVSVDGEPQDGRLLRIGSYATVSRIIFDGNKAKGVEFIYGKNANKVLKAYGKKIILCAGAINTPAILQRSGIGDPAILESLGIKVIVNNPNVGANLVNQYGPNAIVAGPGTTAQPYLHSFVNGSGTPALPAPYTYPNDNTRRLQMVALPIGPGGTAPYEIITFILNPSSKGSVKIVSTNPLVQPKIDLGMFTDGPAAVNGTDANLAVTALQLIQQAVTPANMIFPSSGLLFLPPDVILNSAVKTPSGYTAESHLCSTARMGTSIQNAVVDGNLNVFGTKNLMIADLSVAPQLPDGNTCYCVYVIGEVAAQILGVPTPPGL